MTNWSSQFTHCDSEFNSCSSQFSACSSQFNHCSSQFTFVCSLHLVVSGGGGGAEFLECLNKSECILNGYLVICCWRLRSIGELQPGQADQRDQTRGIEGESSPSVLRSRSVFLPASFFFCWLRRNKKVGLKVTCRLNKTLKTPSYPSH